MVKQDLETNAYQNEMFPIIEENTTSNRTSSTSKKKSQNVGKVIAATTILTASVVGVTAIIENRIPSISSPIVENYLAPYYDEDTGEYYYGSYDLIFEANPSSSLIESIEISVKQIENDYANLLGNNSQEIIIDEVSEIYPLESLEQNDKGNYLIYYPIDDAMYRYEFDFIINYYEENSSTLKSYKRGTYVSDYTYLMVNEVYSSNKINYQIKDDRVDVELTINDFHKGTFDFKIQTMEIEYNGEIYESEDISSSFPMAIEKGPIKYKFSLPKYDLESAILYVTLTGDCYLNNVAMGLESSTFIVEEIIFGTSYKVEAMMVDKNNPSFSINGLNIYEVLYMGPSGVYKTKLDKVVPGSEVWITLILLGEASKDFYLSSSIKFNEEKISESNLTYATAIEVYQGDSEARLEFSFIMPEDNVLYNDIIIENIYEESIQ